MVYYLVLDSSNAIKVNNNYKWTFNRQILPATSIRMLQFNRLGSPDFVNGMIIEFVEAGVKGDFVANEQHKSAFQMCVLAVIPGDVASGDLLTCYEPYNPNEVNFAEKKYLTHFNINLKDTTNNSSGMTLPTQFSMLIEIEE